MRLRRSYRPRRRRHWLLLLAAVAAVFAVVGLVAGHRGEEVAMCAFHGWRAVHDLRRHHPGWGSLQLWEAAHRCARTSRG